MIIFAFLALALVVGLPIYLIWASSYIKTQREKERLALEKDTLLKQKQERIEQQREADLKRQEEQRAAEEKRRMIEEETRKRIEEKYADYDKMVLSIEPYAVSVSEEKAPKRAASVVNNLTFSTVTTRTDMTKLGNFVVLDTETTGLKCSSDEIIDIAAIRFRSFQPVDKFSMLLAPKKPIPERITAITHITDEMVAGCPCFQQIALSLMEFVGDDNVVGHNLPFDLKFIVHYGADITEKKRRYFDTLAIAQKTVKKAKMKWDRELEDYVEDDESDGVPDYKLGTLCSYLGIINRDSHRAENDALATGFLFKQLAEIRKG